MILNLEARGTLRVAGVRERLAHVVRFAQVQGGEQALQPVAQRGAHLFMVFYEQGAGGLSHAPC